MKSIDQRFDSKCGERDANGCIPWLGMKLPAGYGSLRRGRATDGKVLAHRYAYERAHGPIPSGYVVMHACDNPQCVNPEHLSVGTQKDNTDDMVRKGRHAWKNGTPWQRLFVARDVLEFFRNSGMTHAQLGHMFGVGRTRITQILNERVPSSAMKES